VFEVKVLLTETDTTLRPGMTTSNQITTYTIPNALYIPIEAVTTDSGVTVVYKRDGLRVSKQEIETGTMSDDEVVVLRGLDEGERVLLAPPLDGETMNVARLTGPSLKPKTVPGDSARATVLQGAGTVTKAPPPQPGVHVEPGKAAAPAPVRKP
jgi:hypothetical protein